jgi:SAM-dependent methyltransferase
MAILSPVKRFLKKSFYQGRNCFCPVCQTSLRQFYPVGTPVRLNARCPVCESVERHRMIWLYFHHETDLLLSGHKKMLHIAPESCFTNHLNKCLYIDYLSADLNNPAMVKMDITDIQYPDNSFDVIYCSHVLEHVPNDRKAMKELARVLSPNGWAILQVPIDANKTFEDPSIVDPKERERLFGRYDHVRVYGLDYKERLEEAGFSVDVLPYLDKFSTEEKYRYGFNIEKDDIYLCRKS